MMEIIIHQNYCNNFLLIMKFNGILIRIIAKSSSNLPWVLG